MKSHRSTKRSVWSGCLGFLGAAGLLWLAAWGPAGCTPEAAGRRTPPAARSARPSAAETVADKAAPDDLAELPVLQRFDVPFDVSLEHAERILADVRDETFGYDESAFYWLASVVSRLPADLMGADEETTPYEQLLATPSAFRGKPVTVAGVYVTVSPWNVPVEALAKDVPRLYTVSLKEPPGDPANLIATVVVVDDPRTELLPGDAVKVKGYFYKVRKYEDFEGVVRLAPMLVAQRLEPDTGDTGSLGGSPSASFFGALGSFGPAGAFMLVTLAVLVIAFVYIRRMGRRASDAKRPVLPHRIRLRRPDRTGAPFGGGPGSESGRQDAPGGPPGGP